jgi:hypothetical protein
MRRAYKFMLLLYPRGHRDQFAEEMLSVFEEAFDERHGQGWSWSVRFAFAELAGLIGGAAGSWFDRKPAPEVLAASPLPLELIEAQQRVDSNVAGMVHAIANHQFERARVLSNEERLARENLRILLEKYGLKC